MKPDSPKPTRKVSKQTRAKMAEAQRKRWARKRVPITYGAQGMTSKWTSRTLNAPAEVEINNHGMMFKRAVDEKIGPKKQPEPTLEATIRTLVHDHVVRLVREELDRLV